MMLTASPVLASRLMRRDGWRSQSAMALLAGAVEASLRLRQTSEIKRFAHPTILSPR
jgi:hypothetical protein